MLKLDSRGTSTRRGRLAARAIVTNDLENGAAERELRHDEDLERRRRRSTALLARACSTACMISAIRASMSASAGSMPI
jgi:hypothetical protein